MKSISNLTYALFNKHKIVVIVISFIAGILFNEYTGNPWIIIAILGIIGAILSLIIRNLGFLLFIPLGLAFSANSQLISTNNILNFTEKKIEVEGVLYRSPESRESGARLYLDTDTIIHDGVTKSVSGKVIIYSADNTQLLAYGDRVRFLDVKLRSIENYKNPGGFDLKRFYERQSIYARGFVDSDNSLISFGLAESYSPILHYIDGLRIKFRNFVLAGFPSPESAILNAITVGDKAGIPQETRAEFSKAGVAHILAISGLHVGAVAIAFFFLIKWLLKRSEYVLLRFQVPRLAAGMTILPIFLYTAVAGFSTSTVRAFIMISLYLVSIIIGKEEYRVNTLCAAALIILLWHPWSLFELSFQLSFAAVFGILIAHKFYPFKFNTFKDKFYSLTKTTIAATLITFPFIAHSFGILPLVSIPANLILVPLVEIIIVPMSLLSFIGYLISPSIAGVFISVNIFFIGMLSFGVEAVLRVPYSSLTIPPMNFVSWVMFFLIVAFLILNSVYPKIKYIIPLIILGFVVSLVSPYPGKSSNGILDISFLDVGARKNLVFVKLPSNKNIVIDGGYSKSDQNGYLEKTVITKYLLNEGVREIDILILSSTDKDTLSGAVHLIDTFNVAKLMTNGDKLSGRLWEQINNKDIKWDNLSNADELLSSTDLKFKILRAGDEFQIEDSSMPDPIAFKLIYMEDEFLFGNSLDLISFQNELINEYSKNIDSTVIYLPNINIQEDFIDYISPKILVTGNTNIASNKLRENLSAIRKEMIILETDKDGAITITSDGKKLRVRSFTNEKESVLH
ncbi:MAG: DNA internalization-related competence protein ComEC/Rec2 [Thermodesulfobacteriota bacterium]|nr:MAG: DNA internalization-related competence protein ComEC/Rec2 [Thermodesulfobacteriota bacterium]